MPTRAENQAKYLAEVETTYFLLEEHFDTIYEHCTEAVDRQLLRNLHAAARDAYWRGVASSLEDGNQVVRDIYGDLVTTNQQIKNLIAGLQNVGAVLSLVKQAVRLAGSLVTLAAA